MRTNLNQKKISEMYEQFTLDNIDLAPSYQRRPVWSIKSKTYLIDTILRSLPIPKFFFQLNIDSDTGKTCYDVVDGQQRLTAIFDFIKGEYEAGAGKKDFVLLKKNHPKPDSFDSELEGKGFRDLDKTLQTTFWSYPLSFEELEEANDSEIRDMFVRLNLSGEKLKDQELRHAAYDGDFKTLVYELADQYVEDLVVKKIVPASQVKRMADAEFISELLATILRGIQDKKKSLDSIYSDLDSMDEDDVKDLKDKFKKTWKLVEQILDDETISTTRFKKKTDFYSVFFAVYHLTYDKRYKLDQDNQKGLRDSLIKFSTIVSLDSDDPSIRAYNDSCLQAGDSIQHRHVRHDYLVALIEPFFIKRDPNRQFTRAEREFMWHSTDPKNCGICGKEINEFSDYELDHKDSWTNGGSTTIENSQIAHVSCNRSKGGN